MLDPGTSRNLEIRLVDVKETIVQNPDFCRGLTNRTGGRHRYAAEDTTWDGLIISYHDLLLGTRLLFYTVLQYKEEGFAEDEQF